MIEERVRLTSDDNTLSVVYLEGTEWEDLNRKEVCTFVLFRRDQTGNAHRWEMKITEKKDCVAAKKIGEFLAKAEGEYSQKRNELRQIESYVSQVVTRRILACQEEHKQRGKKN